MTQDTDFKKCCMCGCVDRFEEIEDENGNILLVCECGHDEIIEEHESMRAYGDSLGDYIK